MELITERKLRQIGENNRRMEQLREKYQELRYAGGTSAKPQDGMPHASSATNSSMNSVETAYDIELEYKELYCRNMELIRKARAYIDEIPDWTIRLVLTLKYINNMPTYEAAANIGITEQECRRILTVHFHNVF